MTLFLPKKQYIVSEILITMDVIGSLKPARKTNFRHQTFSLYNTYAFSWYTCGQVMWVTFGPNLASSISRTSFIGNVQHQNVNEPYIPTHFACQLKYVQTTIPKALQPVVEVS